MTRINRPAAAGGAAVLLALCLSACGGAPTGASEKDFCDALTDQSWTTGLDEDSSGDEIVEALQKWAAELEETGTPEDIPDDAREGFEVTIDTLNDLEGDDFDNADDLDSVEDDLSEDEQEKVDALSEYREATCESEVPEEQ